MSTRLGSVLVGLTLFSSAMAVASPVTGLVRVESLSRIEVEGQSAEKLASALGGTKELGALECGLAPNADPPQHCSYQIEGRRVHGSFAMARSIVNFLRARRSIPTERGRGPSWTFSRLSCGARSASFACTFVTARHEPARVRVFGSLAKELHAALPDGVSGVKCTPSSCAIENESIELRIGDGSERLVTSFTGEAAARLASVLPEGLELENGALELGCQATAVGPRCDLTLETGEEGR